MFLSSCFHPSPLKLTPNPLQTATTNLQTSSLTQAIAFKLLEAWGYAGFKKHAETVSAFYRVKRDVFQRAMVTHLSGLAEWTPPEAGMFFWSVYL